ncbi:MAG TPA: DUF3037 domain-containing protein [Marmoricola sp.]|jgi:hypothetical protein|nr:DUF3037 domain-containing protein [Marmoricola sp.]
MTRPPREPLRLPYQYVVLRCVPRVEREEFLNVGVVLYCQRAEFLASAGHVDEARLDGFARGIDVGAVRRTLAHVDAVCRGEDGLGPAAAGDLGVRFGYLRAPRSTVVQPGPVHGGLTSDPAAELQRLVDQLVR